MKITNLQKFSTISAGAAVLLATRAQFALAACDPSSGSALDGAQCSATTAQQSKTFGGFLGNITDVLIFLVGALSVIMIVVGALRMVISAGNPSSVKAARDTIFYAIIGVIVALSAYAIIHFVLVKL